MIAANRISTFVSFAIATAVAIPVLGCGGNDGNGIQIDATLSEQSRPSKRSDTGGAYDPSSGKVAVFGGDDGPIVNQIPMARYRNDTWVYSPSAGWSEVIGAGPSARGRHSIALDSAGRMLLFGGRFRADGQSGNYTLYDDLWAFDFAAETWTELQSTSAAVPSARFFAASAFSATDGFVVYGGGTNLSGTQLTPTDDVWRFQNNAWTQITPSGTPPSTRLFVAYAHDTMRNRLVVFGGQVGDFVSPGLSDLYALNLATGEWSQLQDGTGTAPSGRFSASMTYDADSDLYLMIGGHADPGVANDAWAFNPSAGIWSQLRVADTFTGAALGCGGNPREIPEGYVIEDLTAPERRAGGVFTMIGDQAWLFGGESDCSDHLDDVWTLAADGQWSEVLEARSGESCGRRGDDCQCLCL